MTRRPPQMWTKATTPLAVGLLLSAAATGWIAVRHMLLALAYGRICGGDGGLGHCWACYATVALLGAAVIVARGAAIPASAMRPARRPR